jgi:hypothetical protein
MRTDGEPGPKLCPEQQTLRRFLAGKLPEETSESVARHLDCCSKCAAILGALALDAHPFGVSKDGNNAAALLAHPEFQRMMERAKQTPLSIERPLFRETPVIRGKIDLPGYTDLEPLSPRVESPIYRARCGKTSKDVAARFVPAFAVAGRERMSKSQRSSIVVARASGGRVLPITDIVLAGARVAFVRPLVKEAISLDRIIREARRPQVEQALRWLDQIVDCMAAVHAAGECYPELRPSNVLIDGEDAVWLTDFGIARVLSPNAPLLAVDHIAVRDDAGFTYLEPSFRVGHAGYVAPEEWSGQEYAVRAGDLFRIGVAAYHALTLRLPYPTIANEKQRPRAVGGDDGFKVDLSTELEKLILRSLAPRPEDRFPSAVELAAAWHKAREKGG